MLNLPSILEAVEYFLRIHGFHKKKRYKKIQAQVKNGFLIKKNLDVVFGLLLLLRILRPDSGLGAHSPHWSLNIRYCLRRVQICIGREVKYGKIRPPWTCR